MKGKIISIFLLIAFIFVCTSGLIEAITTVAVWLITLNLNAPTISILGQLLVKYGTWVITFDLVRKLFKAFGWYDSDAMKIVYAVISAIISFALSWVIMVFEQYMWIIAIIVGSILIALIALTIALYVVNKRKEAKEGAENA